MARIRNERISPEISGKNTFAGSDGFPLRLIGETKCVPGFVRALDDYRGGIVIELQLFDVYADLGDFLFARDFLHERGYRFCLDATTHMSLPLIDRAALGFDLVKLLWQNDLADQFRGSRGQALRSAAEKVGIERLILARCDSEQALEAGETLGITLYQGHLLDEMLARNVTRQDKVEALTDALTRHRAASR